MRTGAPDATDSGLHRLPVLDEAHSALAAILTIIVLVCAASASLVTLAWRGSFPGPSPAAAVNAVLAEARGWSAATLLLAIPLAVVALAAARRGSLRGRLVWLGSLAYFVYTYLEFAVSPPFTALCLLHVVAFACAIPALVMGIASVDVDGLPSEVLAKERRDGPSRSSRSFSRPCWRSLGSKRSCLEPWPGPLAGRPVKRPSGTSFASLWTAGPFAIASGLAVILAVAFFRAAAVASRERVKLPSPGSEPHSGVIRDRGDLNVDAS